MVSSQPDQPGPPGTKLYFAPASLEGVWKRDAEAIISNTTIKIAMRLEDEEVTSALFKSAADDAKVKSADHNLKSKKSQSDIKFFFLIFIIALGMFTWLFTRIHEEKNLDAVPSLTLTYGSSSSVTASSPRNNQ